MRPEYREEPCRSALNRVKGMMFNWSLNPYMGCAHQCTFCYVRALEKRADRPSDDRYGTSIRVKANVVDVLRRELGRGSWKDEAVAIGAATDPYQPAEGNYPADSRLPRGPVRAGEPILGHHPWPDGRPQRRYPGRGVTAGQGVGDVLGADARRPNLAADGAEHRPSAAAPAGPGEAAGGGGGGRHRDGSGGDPIMFALAGPPDSPRITEAQIGWSCPRLPQSPPAGGPGPCPFEVGHCGLWNSVDFDGSWWVPVGEVDGDIPSMINAEDGQIRLLTPTTAEYLGAYGTRVTLGRFPGPKHLRLCM